MKIDIFNAEEKYDILYTDPTVAARQGAERKQPDQTVPEQQYHTRQWTSPELWNCTAMSQTNS